MSTIYFSTSAVRISPPKVRFLIKMLGATAQSELAKLQRLCNIFVLTSSYEGLPLVVLEALACGNPVVTTRAGETPQLLRPGSGVVCEERPPEAVAGKF